jgi:hypothetical protein
VSASYPGQLDGAACTVDVTDTALVGGGRSIAYVDMDTVSVAGHAVTIAMADGSTVALGQFGPRTDDFLLKFSESRRCARRAALLQWTGDKPIDEYGARQGDDAVNVALFADGVTVEGWGPAPAMAPFSLIDAIARDGYAITVTRRAGLDPIQWTAMGARTDEFLLDFERARNDLVTRTGEAYAALAPSLAGFAAPDGWAVDRAGAGSHWGGLRGAVGGDRAAEVDELEQLCGERLRIGVKADFAGASMPFVLAPANGKVAVEGTASDEARATFVFRTDDVDRLNAVLLLTSFRREAISLPADQLGRWALAVRTLDIVRWARDALVDRVVHDDSWTDKVRAALA